MLASAATHIVAALLAASAAVASTNCHGFLDSCGGVELLFFGDRRDEPWLHANGGCGDNKGGRAYGYFDLNKKFANSNGVLKQSDEGNFGHSCDNIRYSNGVLAAECGDGRGGKPTTSLKLNDYICNAYGQMESF